MKNSEKNMKEMVNHFKENGFVFQSSEIYGGISNTWDYGPLAVLMMNNLKKMWIKKMIKVQENNHLIDSKIILHPSTWKSSGHLDNFTDPLIENKVNNKRYRADHIYEEFNPGVNAGNISNEEIEDFLNKNVFEYDSAKTKWSKIHFFNLMFKTGIGTIEDKKQEVYLRPETAQGIFINFNNLVKSMKLKLPFGIGQIGKAFRNEVTPGNFIFRTREFEQMELEYFVKPGDDDKEYQKYVNLSKDFILSTGIKKESIKERIHDKDELAHYAKGTVDIEFDFPWGWGELMGIANRTDFDLKSHNKNSNIELRYFDQNENKWIIPYVIEPSIGLDRLLLSVLVDSYTIENIDNDDSRIVMKLDKNIAPYKCAILPLVKKLSPQAKEIFNDLINSDIEAIFDETGTIGKRYRRQDAIGTYFSITFDYDSIEDGCVTIRDRDTREQKRVKITDIKKYII